MQRIRMLLVYAAMLVAYGHASPYSRIPDQSSDIYSQYSDRSLGANGAAAVAQAYASANSDSHSGGYASASSSSSAYATNNVNVNPGNAPSSQSKTQLVNAGGQKSAHPAQSGHANQDYWWMNSNSPFQTHTQPSSSCNSNGCSGGGSTNVNVNQGSANGGSHVGSNHQSDNNFQGNPFLQGSMNAGSPHSKNQHDISKNPFFTGSASSGVSSSASASANANSGTNQFQQNYDTNFGQFGQKSDQEHNDGYFGQSVDHGNVGGGLSVSCSGDGKICVAKHLCNNGYVSGSVQGLTQIKSDDQQCDVDTEVCCALGNGIFSPPVDQATAGTYESVSQSDNQLYIKTDSSSPINGGIFGQSNNRQHGIDLNAGDQGQQNVDYGDSLNGYLPPIGSAPSNNVPAFSKPPQPEGEPDNIPSPSGPAPTHLQLGCAAALICVEEQYCGMDGMINPTSVTLSSKQLLMRVPLSDCKNPDNGVIGKCCRDPNYVDPWPTGNLPANYTGGFDEQGFPTFLNIQRTRPTKKLTGPPGVKGVYSPVKNTPQFPASQSPPQRFGFSPTFSSQTSATSPPAQRVEFSPTFPPQTSVRSSPPQRYGLSSTFSPQTSATSLPAQRVEFSSTFPPQTSVTTSPPQRFGFSSTSSPQTFVTSSPPQQFGYSSTFPPPTSVTPPPAQRFAFSPPAGFPQLVDFPNSIGQGFVNILGGKPSQSQTPVVSPVSGVKEEYSPGNIPAATKRPFPLLPNFQIPFHKNKFDESSSDTNPIVVAPHGAGFQCGVRNSVQRPIDLNDVDVGFGEIPWEAMVLANREKKLLCSGAIIAPNAVLTAARCVYGFNADEVSIKAGEWKLGYELKHEEPLPFEIVQVSSIIVHPGFQPNYPSHDMAILMLNHSVKFDQHVGTICVRPQIEQPYALVGKKCISTGWGKHVLQSHLAGAIMHSIDVDVIDQGECQQRLSNAESQIEIDDSLVCTKAHKQNNNMCQVDLGGPLACDRGDGIYEIIGVYNQDTGCLPTNQVATFAIIDDSWIKYVLANPPAIAVDLYAPAETLSRNVPHAHSRKDEPCDCQKSNLSPDDNQYLPPV